MPTAQCACLLSNGQSVYVVKRRLFHRHSSDANKLELAPLPYIISSKIVLEQKRLPQSTMTNNQQNFEELEIVDMVKYRSKNRKFMITIGIILLIIITLLMSTIFINSKFMEAKMDKKYAELDEKLFQLENAYKRIGNQFFLKSGNKMSYKEGQETCHKMQGNILEFDERTDYRKKLETIIRKLNLES